MLLFKILDGLEEGLSIRTLRTRLLLCSGLTTSRAHDQLNHGLVHLEAEHPSHISLISEVDRLNIGTVKRWGLSRGYESTSLGIGEFGLASLLECVYKRQI